MSPVTRTRRDGSVKVARYGAVQPGMVAWLTVVWCVVWQELSLWNILTGVLVGTVVCLVFPLPPLRLQLKIRPLAFAWLVVRFHYDIVMASIDVARVTLSRRPLSNAVIAVPLRTPSDFVLTIHGEMISLIPGTVMIEAQRSTYTVYLHVLDVADEEAVEETRRQIEAQERRIVRAFFPYTGHLDLPPDEAQRDAFGVLERRQRARTERRRKPS